MDELTYLNRFHEAASTAIGLARLHLLDGDVGKAGEALDKACETFRDLSEARMGPELTARAKTAGLIA